MNAIAFLITLYAQVVVLNSDGTTTTNEASNWYSSYEACVLDRANVASEIAGELGVLGFTLVCGPDPE